jgi:hypothetical protein
MRTLLALFRRGRGRHRATVMQEPAPVTHARSTPPRYVVDGEEVALIRPYFLAFEERARQGRVQERAA